VVRKALLICACLCALVAFGGRPADAGPSPAGIVRDDTSTFTAEQLSDLDEGLSGLRYPVRVIVNSSIFPGGRPHDAEARFQAYAAELLKYFTEKDTILITVALSDRLVDFRVHADGPVNEEFIARTGRPFGDHAAAILEVYRVPARAGDVPGGILAAAEYIDELIDPLERPLVVPESPAPSVQAPGAPGPVAPSEPPGPSREPVSPVGPRTSADPWPWLGGAVLFSASVFWTVKFRRYRLAHRDALKTRDKFLGNLLRLIEKELPQGAMFSGDETRKLVFDASATADMALAAEQEAEQLRERAERRARFSRFSAATTLIGEAADRYHESARLLAAAKETWAPVADALANWSQAQSDAGARLSEAGAVFSAEKVRTGWPLTNLVARHERVEAGLALARSSRDEDPVRAVRLARESGDQGAALVRDLKALPELSKALDEQHRRRLDAIAAVDEARRTLGLRFVELSPDESLARAAAAEAEAGAALPPGDVGRAREAIEAAHAASDSAVSVVQRYRKALEQYPLKRSALSGELGALPDEERQAAQTLARLMASYAAEDWEDVAGLADDLARLRAEGAGALAEAARMTDPSVQLYLRAVELLEQMLDRRETLREGLRGLLERPAELGALADETRRNLDAVGCVLGEADDLMVRGRLVLPPEPAGLLDDARRRYLAVEQLGLETPLPVRRWATEVAAGLTAAIDARAAVAELERLAASARAELARVQTQASEALGYERYDRHGRAGVLRGALAAAEMAIGSGNYQSALMEAERALECCRGLEWAYRDFVNAQLEEERRRREAEEAAHRTAHSTFSSNDDNHFGSSSSNDDNTSGGGGSW